MRLLDILGAKPKEHENEGYTRRANFAGSWYTSSPTGLDESLSKFLANAEQESSKQEDSGAVRGLVAPHAGYSYSGPTAAFAYRSLTQALKEQHEKSDQKTTILVLHPSHYFYLNGCAVSGANVIETPLGNLPVNRELANEILESSSKFTSMKQDTDEQEHSGELQYPYIAKACKDAGVAFENCMVLPIMVGSLDTTKEEDYGKLLAPIIARSHVITVVSSDFCHWGSRFRYQPFLGESGDVFEHIEEMDRTGMNHIELQEPGAFAKYLKKTSNTICGRHPIGVWLQAVKNNKETDVEALDIKFVRYCQSSQVRYKSDSSVSYASAVARRSSG